MENAAGERIPSSGGGASLATVQFDHGVLAVRDLRRRPLRRVAVRIGTRELLHDRNDDRSLTTVLSMPD